MKFGVKYHHPDTSARICRLETSHASFTTPVFMPVGTLATVKAISPTDLRAMGANIILGNTYHLYLRPGAELIKHFGGLHSFMGWDGAILTDSGGFQLFSMSELLRATDEGIHFSSHIDGSKHFMSPESCIETQKHIGSDIMMVLDHLTPADATSAQVKAALDRTIHWAGRCLDAHRDNPSDQALFAIQQGGFDTSLRKECIDSLVGMPFDGFAVGGLSVGEEKKLMYEIAAYSSEILPRDKPRYVMGVGTPLDLLQFIDFGYDMFDCVLPTRNARTGLLYTGNGPITIKNARYREDPLPIDPGCKCYTCSNFSRAYLRHLFINKEILGIMLNTTHNLHFYLDFMRQVREAIKENRFDDFKRDFETNYTIGEN
jgi:queuine tRNA-ribosyltransferase